MLSVKHINLIGNETIRLATKVEFIPATAKGRDLANADDAASDSLWVYLPDGERVELDGGTVFVMNDLGKTISRYDLGASMVPRHTSAHEAHRMGKASVNTDFAAGVVGFRASGGIASASRNRISPAE